MSSFELTGRATHSPTSFYLPRQEARRPYRSSVWLASAAAIAMLAPSLAAADDPPYIIPEEIVSYITLVGDNFVINVGSGDSDAPDPEYIPCPPPREYLVCSTRHDLVDLTLTEIPDGAIITQSSCVTPAPALADPLCNSLRMEWTPSDDDVGVHRIGVRALSRTAVYDTTEKEWISVEPAASGQLTAGEINVAVSAITLDSVEITQVVQVGQSPAELKAYLYDNDGKPPVPMVAEKPVALRIIPGEVPQKTPVEVEVWTRLLEPDLDDPPLEPEIRVIWQLSPKCTAEDRRRRVNKPPATCRSIDIYQDPEEDVVLLEGRGEFWVFLKYAGANTLPNLYGSVDQNERWAELSPQECIIEPDGRDRRIEPGCLFLSSNEYLNRFEANRFLLTTKRSDVVRIGAVDLCTSLDDSRCVGDGPATALRRHVRLLRKFAPTHAVKVFDARASLHLGLAIADGDRDELDCYDIPGLAGRTKTLDGWIDRAGNLRWVRPAPLLPAAFCEADIWWEIMLVAVDDAFSRSGLPRRSPDGVQNFFFGLADQDALHGGTLGYAYVGDTARKSAAHAGMAVITGNRLLDEETIAHEVGHMLGLPHSFDVPPWPYTFAGVADERIWSGDPRPPGGIRKIEVGLDVQKRYQQRAAKPGELRFDVMSYDRLQWITPYHYYQMLQILDPPPADPAGQPGQFWLVSGFIDDQDVDIRPLFQFDAVARTDTGSGTHRIDVRDAGGAVLFTRLFTPVVGQTRATDGRTRTGRPRFSEMIPVQPNAVRIVIEDEAGSVTGSVVLGGSTPAVTITDLPGGILSGPQRIEWSVSDPDSARHVFWVEYSADAGASWITLSQARYEPSLEVDLDRMPGSSGNALIRVYASDGVNTGSAISNTFEVATKPPITEIIAPENGEEYFAFDGLVLEGFAYDIDDGVLPDAALTWTSDRQGFLGSGAELTVPVIDVGEHVITLTAVDAEGNTVSDTVAVRALDGLPTETPVAPSPVVDAGGPYTGDEGTVIVFDGSASFDPEGGALVYGWDFGDGEMGSGVGPGHVFADDGEYEVTLTVTDIQSLDASDTASALIANVAPAVTADPGLSGEPGETLTLSATFSDAGIDDGPWAVTWRFGDGDVSEMATDTQGGIMAEHAYASPGVFTATVSVRDKDGGADSEEIEVTVTESGPEPPAPIDDLTARAKSGKVSLYWSPAPDADAYNVYRGASAGGPFELIAGGHQTDYATYLDEGLTNGTTYYFVVTVLADGLESSDSNTASATPLARRTR